MRETWHPATTRELFVEWFQHQVFEHHCLKVSATSDGCYPAPANIDTSPGALLVRVLMLKDIPAPPDLRSTRAYPLDTLLFLTVLQTTPDRCEITVDYPDDVAGYAEQVRQQVEHTWPGATVTTAPGTTDRVEQTEGATDRKRWSNAKGVGDTSSEGVNMDETIQYEFDVFISHASEDKETIAAPLAEALTKCGLTVWIDKQQLSLGDSLRRKIDDGLSKSRFGIVILSQHFFTKEWPKKELDALVSREDGKAKVVLPVWHKISHAGVARYSPMLADKLAISTSEGLVRVVEEILRATEPGRFETPKGLKIEPELIYIPAGEFLMGSDKSRDPNAEDDELPQHKVYLDDFYIAKYPVMETEYRRFLYLSFHDSRAEPGGGPDHPATNVSWHDAVAYCQSLSRRTGKHYRLPTEAEWEKAARGGLFLDGDAVAKVSNPNSGRIYPWGDTSDASRCNVYRSNEPLEKTPVQGYPTGASPYGVMDMAGNVWEWTSSLYGRWTDTGHERLFSYPYDAMDGRENLKAGNEMNRVLRGGAFYFNQENVRCAARYWYNPNVRYNFIGFRVVVAPGFPEKLWALESPDSAAR